MSSCLNKLKSHLLKFRILTVLFTCVSFLKMLNSPQGKLLSVAAFVTSFSLFMNRRLKGALLPVGLSNICVKKLPTKVVQELSEMSFPAGNLPEIIIFSIKLSFNQSGFQILLKTYAVNRRRQKKLYCSKISHPQTSKLSCFQTPSPAEALVNGMQQGLNVILKQFSTQKVFLGHHILKFSLPFNRGESSLTVSDNCN